MTGDQGDELVDKILTVQVSEVQILGARVQRHGSVMERDGACEGTSIPLAFQRNITKSGNLRTSFLAW